jgi:hypothetical protein
MPLQSGAYDHYSPNAKRKILFEPEEAISKQSHLSQATKEHLAMELNRVRVAHKIHVETGVEQAFDRVALCLFDLEFENSSLCDADVTAVEAEGALVVSLTATAETFEAAVAAAGGQIRLALSLALDAGYSMIEQTASLELVAA